MKTGEDCEHEQTSKKEGHNYEPDPTGMRIGIPPTPTDPQIIEELLRSVQDLEEYIDKAQVQRRIPIDSSCLGRKIDIVRDAVSMAYPMGLPDHDLVKISLDGTRTDMKVRS